MQIFKIKYYKKMYYSGKIICTKGIQNIREDFKIEKMEA